MTAAVDSVNSGSMGLREASRIYNIPVETLQRRVRGLVEMNCKPGPCTVLSNEKEEDLQLISLKCQKWDMVSAEKQYCGWPLR